MDLRQRILDRLAEWEKVTEATPPGPWITFHGQDNYAVLPAGRPGQVAGLVQSEALAQFIALSRSAMPAMIRALREAVELHRPFELYDECGHEHRSDELGVEDISEVGLCCKDGLVGTICYECGTDDGEVWEDSDEYELPCATLKRLAAGLGLEGE